MSQIPLIAGAVLATLSAAGGFRLVGPLVRFLVDQRKERQARRDADAARQRAEIEQIQQEQKRLREEIRQDLDRCLQERRQKEDSLRVAEADRSAAHTRGLHQESKISQFRIVVRESVSCQREAEEKLEELLRNPAMDRVQKEEVQDARALIRSSALRLSAITQDD